MKKMLAIGMIFLFFIVIIIPSINANIFHIKKVQNNNWLKNRCKYIREEIPDNQRVELSALNDPPEKFDWRDYNGENWITSIRTQGECGSCSAFAINAVIEAKINIKNNDPDIDRDLSEAHIFFCTDHSCNEGSGFFTLAKFIRDNGVCDELSFPYGTAIIGNSLSCKPSNNWRCNGVTIRNYRSLNSDIENIKKALIEYGPLSASMEVYVNFEIYTGGIYDNTVGDHIGNHAVCIVGYDDEDQCWICKNSWSKLWGESGYFRIKYGLCEIEEDVKYIAEVDDLYPGSPYIPEKPSGTLLVKPDYYGDYKTKTHDPDNGKIKYLWDWDGDFKVDYETSFIESGEECESVNKWEEEGKYEVRVRAEDKNGLKSDWSHSLTITVKKSRAINRLLFFEYWDFPLLKRIFT